MNLKGIEDRRERMKAYAAKQKRKVPTQRRDGNGIICVPLGAKDKVPLAALRERFFLKS